MQQLTPHSSTNHLDIGCGSVPRNPYHREQLHTIDTRALTADDLPAGAHYTQANFAIEPLPFSNDFFDSVSAYDVLEHIPRQLLHPTAHIIYPFIQLMNEIHRVLKPGGLFLATTPGYPRPEHFKIPPMQTPSQSTPLIILLAQSPTEECTDTREISMS